MEDKKEQFSAIYDQYIEKIYRFVYIKVNSQEIAEDITSKVFTKAWEAFRIQNTEFRIQNIGAFLYQSARNAVIDYYREKGRTKVISTEYVSQIIDNKVNLQEKAIVNSDFEAVKTAIQCLKKDYQDIIIWHYLDGMEVPEIAEIMQKPAGTVRVMLHRGLNELKKGLGSKEA